MVILMFGIITIGFALGIPIFLSIGLATFIHPAEVGSTVLIIFMQRIFASVTRFSYIGVPLFMLTGYFMSKSGITDELIKFCNSIVGHFRGGLAQVNIVTSMFFAGLSGSAMADTAALGSVLIPAMEKEGYEKGFAAAVTAA